MSSKDISNLLIRYEQMLASGKPVYFDADEYDELAEYFDQLEDVDAAKNIVELGLHIHPASDSLRLKHAKFMVYDEQYGVALRYLNSIFASYDFESHLLKIECLLQLDLYAEAYQLTTEVLQDKETDLDVILSELGFVYIEADYYDEAILYLEKSLECQPDNKEVLADLVYAYETKENFSLAIERCNTLLDLDPYSAEAWMTLGKLYSLVEDYEKAIDAFDFVATIEGENLSLLKLKAHCLVLKGRLDEAVDVLKECVAISSEEELLYISLVDCYIGLDLYKEALDTLIVAEDKVGLSGIGLAKKGCVCYLQGDLGEARRYIEEALVLGIDSFEVNLISAEIYQNLTDLGLARHYYEKALSLKKDEDSDILSKLVSLCVKQNDIKSGIKYLKRIGEITSFDTISDKLALLYLEDADRDAFKECIEVLDEEHLKSLYSVFYSDELVDEDAIDRQYLLKKMIEAFDYRLISRNIKD